MYSPYLCNYFIISTKSSRLARPCRMVQLGVSLEPPSRNGVLRVKKQNQSSPSKLSSQLL